MTKEIRPSGGVIGAPPSSSGHSSGASSPDTSAKTRSKIPRRENSVSSGSSLSDRSIDSPLSPDGVSRRPGLRFTPRVRLKLDVPDHYRRSGRFPEHISLDVADNPAEVERDLRERLGLQEDNTHLTIQLEKHGQPVGYQDLLKGGSFEIRVQPDSEVVSGVADMFSDVVCDGQDHYRSVTFSEFMQGGSLECLQEQMELVASGQCPAGVVDVTSIWDVSQDILSRFPKLDYTFIKQPAGQGFQLLFWRRESLAATKAADRYLESQSSQGKAAAEEMFLGVYEEVVVDRHRALQQQARKQLVGGDKSWDQEVHRLTEQASQKSKYYPRGKEWPNISKSDRSWALNIRAEERCFNGENYLQDLSLRLGDYPDPAQAAIKNSPFVQRILPQWLNAHMKPLRRQARSPLPQTRYGQEWYARILISKIDKVAGEFQAWAQTQQQKHHLGQWERHEIEGVREQLEHERVLVVQVMNDPGAVDCARQGMNWNQAMEFKRLGYSLNPKVTALSKLNDKMLSKDHPKQQLGAGMYNTVYLLTYCGRNGGLERRVFKPVDTQERSGWRNVIGEKHYFDYMKPYLTLRNIGVMRVREAMGLPPLVPDVEFTEHRGRIGLSMTLAPGVSLPDAYDNGGLREMIAANDGRGEVFFSQYNQLEWLDALCLQSDRHLGNCVVDMDSGQVTGVDNDICFPQNPYIVRKSQDPNHTQSGGARTGFPLLIDPAMLSGLETLDIDALIVDMEPLLPREELAAMKERYLLLLEHAKGLEQAGFCVHNWSSWKDSASGFGVGDYLAKAENNSEELAEQFRQQVAQIEEELQHPVMDDNHRNRLRLKKSAMENLAHSLDVLENHSYLANLFAS